MRKINVKTVGSKLLTAVQIERMYAIMCKYYDNMDLEAFKQDLYGKDVTFLLVDDGGKIQGFTSIIIYEKEIDCKKIAGVFSGDTIIEKKFRGSFDLPFAWLNYVYNKKEKYDKMFWFMLSKGYRTYRLLPRFFKEHYPCYYKETPKEVSNILDKFALDKFGDKYNPETNIYIPSYNYFLKSGKEEIRSQLLKNLHIRFFQKRNPGFWQGHELVNYADFDRKNLTLYGLIFINFGDSSLVRFIAALSKKVSKLLK